jgi:hypothetical protein
MKVYSDVKFQKRYEYKIKAILLFLESGPSDKKVISCCEALSINNPNFSKGSNSYLARIELLKKEITEKETKDMFVSTVLRILCPHEELTLKNQESATCKVCGCNLGWWCPKSQDNLCHYETDENLEVTLKNRAKIKVLPYYTVTDQEYETEDSCLFCGDPLDRP